MDGTDGVGLDPTSLSLSTSGSFATEDKVLSFLDGPVEHQ